MEKGLRIGGGEIRSQSEMEVDNGDGLRGDIRTVSKGAYFSAGNLITNW